VTEELAFQQAGRNGGTIELHEGSLLAAAVIVNGARDQFLAGTRFAKQEHGRIAFRNGLDHLQHLA
jgi:hypothetical protein